ncbi:MAG: sugar O-acetyltransferase [Longibaculum sp.]
MTEKEKAKLGLWYDANNDDDLIQERLFAKDLCFEYNALKPSLVLRRQEILQQLFHDSPKGLEIVQPFQCDYGYHIHLGENVFINTTCYFMDCASITLGDYVFVGPSCGLYTASHPFDKERRNAGLENAKPIVIESYVWLGANVTVLPGVTIGEGSVIAAGSVVSKDIPPYVIAGGVPCRVMKKIEDVHKK